MVSAFILMRKFGNIIDIVDRIPSNNIFYDYLVVSK